jgi:hypothetical protein
VAGRFRAGRAFLLGDAAHIHSPVGAQGKNTGIGDAVNLAWKLAAALNGSAAEGLLDTYEAERRPFALGLVNTTDRIFTLASKPGRFPAFLRTAVVPIVVPFLMRMPAARRFLFRTVSQIAIRYARSALSVGVAGSVRGGDRLPWVPADDGPDNFAPLSSVAWQAHVYGEASPALTEACAAGGLPLHVFSWTPAAERAGLARDALYVVRPDGYVALANAAADPDRLAAYLEKHALTGVSRPGTA